MANVPLRLGATYAADRTTFALWSPDMDRVSVVVGDHEIGLVRVPDADGLTDVYAAVAPGDHHLGTYGFRVDGRPVRDPCGIMVDPATGRNVVVDLARTGPEGGWSEAPPFARRTDAIVYELHVRDFTVDPGSGVSPERRGRFLGLVQRGTAIEGRPTGIDHLVRLGITHVQIMPMFDFYTCSTVDPGGSRPRCYNWGYDPENFDVPEERYSQDANDPVGRIRELKTTINELHRAGIRVVMDVVYNHVPGILGADRGLGGITPRYFLDKDLSGTGGRTLDGSHPMVARMIADSLAFWAGEYRVDGFRFDLLGVFDRTTVAAWAAGLEARFPGRTLLLYGEPWNGGASDPREAERVRLGTVGTIAEAHVGVFNPRFRDAIRGSNDDGASGGYAFNQGDVLPIIQGSRGAIRFARDFAHPLPDAWDPMFAAAPEQSVNYVGAHDNLCLYDRVLAWAAKHDDLRNADFDYLVRVQQFALGIVLTAQGIPFIHGGDEMLRSKLGLRDSFSAPDMINMVRWNWAIENADVVDYVRNLIALRRAHPAFRMDTWDAVNDHVATSAVGDKVVVTRIDGAAVGDLWREIVTIYNSGANHEFDLGPGTWRVALERSAPNVGADRTVSGTVTAEGTAVTIVYR